MAKIIPATIAVGTIIIICGPIMKAAPAVRIAVSNRTMILLIMLFILDLSFLTERIGRARRGVKPEFKFERCPPSDGPACSVLC